jgi:outer membrane protein assembly factor BamB
LALVFLPLAALLWLPVRALADWTQFQGDAAHSGSVMGAAQAPYKQSWSLGVKAGGPRGQFGLSAPVASGSSVIAIAPTAVLGVDASTGGIQWTVVRDYGPAASPAVASSGGRQVLLYTEGFGSHPPGSSPTPTTSASSPTTASPTPQPSSGAGSQTGAFGSHLAALDLSTLKPLWAPIQLDKVSRTGVTVDGQTAFLGDNAGTVYAIDISSGKILWNQSVGGYLDTPLAATGGKVYATVRSALTKAGAVVALNESDGKIAWSYEVKRSTILSAAAVGSGRVVFGAALLASNGTLQIPTLKAIDAVRGTLAWSVSLNAPLGPSGAPSIVSGAAICFDFDGQVSAYDLATGRRRWDFALNEPNRRASPLVIGPQVLVETANGLLVALDSSTGELVWRSATGTGLLRDALATSDGIVMVRGGVHAGLVAFVHDPGGSLVRVASPTTPNMGKILAGWVAAAIPLAALLLLAGRWLMARAGPAFPDEGPAEADEPIDPWEDR